GLDGTGGVERQRHADDPAVLDQVLGLSDLLRRDEVRGPSLVELAPPAPVVGLAVVDEPDDLAVVVDLVIGRLVTKRPGSPFLPSHGQRLLRSRWALGKTNTRRGGRRQPVRRGRNLRRGAARRPARARPRCRNLQTGSGAEARSTRR